MRTFSLLTTVGTLSLLTYACSSGPSTGTSDLPLHSTDPDAQLHHPGYYDTQIVSYDADNKPVITYQHTTPEQYAVEVAAHQQRVQTPSPGITQGAASGEDIGSQSSAVISNDPNCAAADVWLYNNTSCTNDGNYNLRICFINSDSSNWDYHYIGDLQFRQCSGGVCGPLTNWSGNILSDWSGTQDGSVGGYHWILVNGQWQNVYIASSSWTSGQSCTATTNVSSSNQQDVALK